MRISGYMRLHLFDRLRPTKYLQTVARAQTHDLNPLLPSCALR